MYDKLKEITGKHKVSVFGIANISGLESKDFIDIPVEAYEGLNRAIVIGLRLSKRVLDTIIDSPTKIYQQHYNQINHYLDNIALEISLLLQEHNYNALPIPASLIVDCQRQKGNVSHRKLAELAGLGWIGRNNLLVTPQYGAQVRFASVLTDAELPPNEKLKMDCGECKKCITVCPAGAIKGSVEDFDLAACFNMLEKFKKKLDLADYICGLCVKVCDGKL